MIPRYFTFLEGKRHLGSRRRAYIAESLGRTMREAVSPSKTAAIRSKFAAAERFGGKGL
jgi:hypothetical protein